eukprot:TRINITY_DN34567_c0_g1_i1.p2 TRINITY_DN34567_c0_g1~~TRINITY_DN34567_c0_g1_i1.p2  ORF type:complete len:202 (-),score=39.64 TRINITY_DN34567_c0_g1_i1:191-796(-)
MSSRLEGLKYLVRGTGKAAAVIGVSMGVGDVLCQSIVAGSAKLERWDTVRSRNMWVTGTFVTGPIGHLWQVAVERMFPGKAARTILMKTIVNSGWAFVAGLPLTFLTTTLLKGGSLEEAWAKTKKDLVSTWCAGVCFWPFVNVLVFRFVVLDNRAIANAFAAVLWNIFISFQINKSVAAETCAEEAAAEPGPLLRASSAAA